MKRTLDRKSNLLSILVFLLISAGSYSQTPSLEWAARFGGPGNDAGFSIAPDASGNVFTTGKFSGTADFDPGPGTFNLTSAGSEDIFVSKLDASGNLVWAYGFGGASLDQGRSIAVDPSGNIVITGYFRNTIDFDPGPGIFNLTAPSGLFDVFILKLNGDGNFLWAVSFGDPASNSDVGYSVATDDTGNVYATGTFSGTADFDPGAGTFPLSAFSGGGFTDVFILKLDESGNFVWAKTIGGTDSDIARTLAVDISGNVVIGGVFYGTVDFDPGVGVNNITSSGPKNLFILKLDTNGDFVWAKNLVSSFSDSLQGIATDVNDNVFVTGEFFTSIDLDPGPGNYFQTEVAAGDIFILKLDATGSFLWGAGIGGNQKDSGIAVAVDAVGNSYFTGHYAGTVDFDPGAGVFNLTSTTSNTTDIFVSKYDPSGNFLWAGSMGGTSDFELGKSIKVDIGGNVYLTGDFYNTADFDPGSGVFNLTGSGTAVDAFVVKLASVSATPTIASFTPTSGFINTTVTIAGTNFSTTPANNTVQFNGTTAIVTASSPTSITTTVPVGATTGTITVTVGGNTATSASDFTILSVALPTITSFTPSSGPVGTTVTITGTNFSTTPANNTVQFNGTTALVTASTATSITAIVPVGTTTGTITVTVGGNTATSSTDFTVTASPVITIITQPSPLAVCVGATTTFTTAASGTTNITYQWQFSATLAGTYSSIANGSGYSNVTNATLSVNTTGNFGAGFYRCQVNGDFAVTVFTDAVELIINVIPTPPITTSASKCGPGNITLSANGGTAGQYRWYDLATGGAALVGETNTTFTTPSLSATTTYYVAINNGSCESTRTAVTATINAVPLKPTINSTITPSGNNVSVCSSNTLTLTAPPSFNFYAWSNGETTQQIIITSSGTYSVSVDSGNGCSSPSSDDINVTVIPEPCANQPPVFIATQSTATLSGNISIDLASLISDADNNLDLASLKIVSQPISGAIAEISNTILMIDYSGLSFTGLDKTTIEVCDLLASCTQQDITIEVVGNLIIYSGISPNGDPFNEKWIIQNIESLPDTKVNQVKIYNRWGDLVYETDNYDNGTRAFRGINKNGMEVSSGVYFYKIEFKSGRKMLSGYITVVR